MSRKGWLGSCLLLGAAAVMAETVFYAAPAALGGGDGETAATAAAWTAPELWKKVQNKLSEDDVVVRFAPGEYLVRYDAAKKLNTGFDVRNIGSADHHLTVTGSEDGKTVIRRSPQDDPTHEKSNYPNLVTLRIWRNATLRNLHFRGKEPVGYALQMRVCRDMVVEKCSFVEMPGVFFGASGVNGRGGKGPTDNIVWRNNVFDHVGYNVHAHMLYNANEATNIRVENNLFRDVPGDYIRFRNNCDKIFIRGNKFESTGKYQPEYPFISCPLFNDDDPEVEQDLSKQEKFGSTLEISENTFIRPKMNSGDRAVNFMFHHSGFNPPKMQHLLSRKDAAKLVKMPVPAARAELLRRTGIRCENVQFRNNRSQNVSRDKIAVYDTIPMYGAEKKFPAAEYRTMMPIDRLLTLK